MSKGRHLLDDNETKDTKSSRKKKTSLLLGDESSDDEDDDDNNNGIGSKLIVNKQFAKEYQSRKQQEELRNVQQRDRTHGSDQRGSGRRYGDDDDENGDSSSSSESEDEDGELLTTNVDMDILKTIQAVRKRDESIYDPKQKFFGSNNDDDGDHRKESRKKKSKKTKAKTFKDVERERILEQMEGNDDGDDVAAADEDDNGSTRRNMEAKDPSHLAYDQEQRDLRAAFLKSTKGGEDGSDNDSNDGNDSNNDSDDDDGDMLIVKRRDTPVDPKAEEELRKEYDALQRSTAAKARFVDPRGEVKDGEKFLMDYLKNKRWIDDDDVDDNDDSDRNDYEISSTKQLSQKSQKKYTRVDYLDATRSANDIGDNNNKDDDSIGELEKADDFEAKYNFRFEEAAAATASGADYSIMGYARSGTMQTLRRPDETRRQKRLERKERKAAERKAKEEKLRRLKNAKREQMETKLSEIKKVIGGRDDSQVDEDAMMKLLEGDFDPDKFEKIMADTYGEDFYEKEDPEWKTDTDVRKTLLEEESDAVQIDKANVQDGDLYDNEEEGVDADEKYNDNEEEEEGGAYDDYEEHAFGANDAETNVERKLKEKMQEELYKLDYEDIVAGMPTRFKYRSVEANSYGLSTREILFAKDTTLKNFVSLKKMAPYREEEEHFVGSRKRRRFRDLLETDLEALAEVEGDAELPMVEEDDQEGEVGNESNTKKKRRRQKKGKKEKKKEEEEEEEVVDNVQNPQGDDTNEKEKTAKDETEEPTPKKRRRKKKGSKKKKTEDEGNDGVVVAATAAPDDTVDGEKPPVQEETASTTPPQQAPKEKRGGVDDGAAVVSDESGTAVTEKKDDDKTGNAAGDIDKKDKAARKAGKKAAKKAAKKAKKRNAKAKLESMTKSRAKAYGF